MTPELCRNTTTGFSKMLTDTRDGKEYQVTKLEDGNCWMTTNLQLTKESLLANGKTATLTAADSNVTSNFTMPDTIVELNTTTGKKDFSSDIDYNNVAQIYDGGKDTENWQEGYGAYYNWYAATAGTGNASLSTSGSVASGSICPKEWRLPTKEEFDIIVGQKHGAWNAGWDLSGGFFSAAGYISAAVLSNVGSEGDYWSSISDNSTLVSYKLRVSSYDAIVTDFPVEGAHRYRGNSIRCLFSPN